jgi:uncharacterized membrane protein
MTTIAALNRQRINSIDVLRGLIMLIMALDHIRDVFHHGSPDPTALASTTPILFFTRWITHFCAPNFVFLSGISAFLAGQRRSKKELSIFLIQRGVWLVFIELMVINSAFELNLHFHMLVLQVIWAIGVSMILLGLLIWLPLPIIALIGVLIFFGHNIFDFIHANGLLLKVLFTSSGFGPDSVIRFDQSHYVLDAYAVLPWTGVMLLGYVFGQLFQKGFDADRRQRIIMRVSFMLIVAFFVLRFLNIYGDPAPWSYQKTAALSIISFFNVTKYPCSLDYLCMTLSAGTLLLAIFERTNNRITRIFVVYGSVPFFYYILHFYLIRFLNIIIFYASGFTKADIPAREFDFSFHPVGFGFSLFGVYMIWIIVISTLYLPCRWFRDYKKMHKQWWLSYL